ncbi:glycoside hydrolase family 2 TIM barrel-domain containing protein [uncultured Bacteroides sp.]|uniref:glycoside hydrolase family 2 TIM barrel-domain containing protein n=1 Tax=uncultured Bacteroides sp. TaxID=162156 RepID=UPI00261CCCD2|nr:glycoside hydrolase family 2 TIM barrel-domain containing protein [uncultured Bacteroides sp.]
MKLFTYIGIFCCMLLGACSSVSVSPREKICFNDNWSFSLSDNPKASETDFDDKDWRVLNLPHDWAIEGDFSKDNPSGTGGGALPGGTGWYRKTFVPGNEDSDKIIRIDFDGIYMNSEVFINGQSLGKRPYGYISFGYDITPYLKWNEKNVIAVRVDNSEQPNSRWYSGCGIYRNVWLTKTNPVHVDEWGTYVTASDISNNNATLNIVTTVQNSGNDDEAVILKSILNDMNGTVVAETESSVSVVAGQKSDVNHTLNISSPKLWDTENPYLYSLVTEIIKDGKCIDRYTTTTGVRDFKFDAEKGFILNGKQTKINGVCMHHDLGCLGAAVNTRAIERQLEILKEMGCNGIRCSHNPPAPELLDLCDKMGFIVMDEAFDMWRKKKTSHDYARYFNEWHEKDLRDFILRDRNHPSIFVWSIGNEVLEQWSDAKADTLSLEEANLILNFGHSADMLAKDGEMSVNSLLTKKLADFVRELDPTRPITAGCNKPNPGNHLFKSGALDIIGYNYHNANIPDVPKNFPGKPFIITESNSALMTRGYYRMPSNEMFIWPERWDKPFYDESFSCSSYENCHVPWGNTHEENIKLVRNNDFISGQYIWTGFDYIGEPTPYGWPARSSYFGIVDLAGFPKDVYYLYKAEWTNKQVLHLFPHWNWTEGQEIDMWCYYNNADEVELFINGESQGIRSKDEDNLHVVWRVKFIPGTVKVVARKGSNIIAEKEIHTAGTPHKIRLTPDRNIITADGKDLSFVTVEVLDKDNNLCPLSENLINFEIKGNAFIAGVDNGCQTSMERFKDNKRKAFNGKCLVVLQNNGEKGTATLTANSNGLESSTIEIKSK